MNPKIKKALSNPSLIPKALINKCKHYYKLYITKDEFTVAVTKWFKDNGDSTLRLDYPLTSESIVFDLGGYEGDFAADIYHKYNCYVYVFEPVKKHYLACVKRFENNEKIKCFNYGLSNENGSFLISNEDDGSSIIKNNSNANNCEQVFIKCFGEEFNALQISHIDLLKINIEGPEFLILPYLIEENIIQKIEHLQVQFHTFYPNAIFMREEIRKKLSKTHTEQWNYPFVWESWTKNT